MGKYLTNFKTKEEYEAFKAGGSYLTPNVSFIETAGSVINDSYQVQGDSAKVVDALHFLDYQSLIWVNLVTKEYNTSIANEEGIPIIHSEVLNKESTIAYDTATGVITIPHNRLLDISVAPCVTMMASNLGDEEYPDYRVVCGDLLISNVNFYKNGEMYSSAITRGYIEYEYGRTMLRLEYKEGDLFNTWEGNFEKVTFDITFPSGNTYKMEATGDVYF